VWDPEDLARWQADGVQAQVEVRARGGSELEVHLALAKLHQPRLLRYDVVEEPIRGYDNDPVIQAHDGAFLQPFAAVLKEIVEHSTRGSLTGSVTGRLARYLAAKRVAG
jgi:hypothetical protein